MRKTHILLKDLSKDNFRVDLVGRSGLALSRSGRDGSHHLLCLYNLSEQELPYTIAIGGDAEWNKLLDSKEKAWMEDGQERRNRKEGGSALLKLRGGDQIQLAPLSVSVYESKTFYP